MKQSTRHRLEDSLRELKDEIMAQAGGIANNSELTVNGEVE